MQTVILVGTDHRFQLPTNGPHSAGIAQFRDMLLAMCLRHSITAIAEEMSLHALQENNVAESVAQQVCALLDLCHQLSDPSPEERRNLGIRQDNDIRVEHIVERIFDEWTQQEKEADVLSRGSVPSDRIREQFWLRKIQELSVWPLLFICGANHFTPFAALLRANRIDVLEVHADWGPAAN